MGASKNLHTEGGRWLEILNALIWNKFDICGLIFKLLKRDTLWDEWKILFLRWDHKFCSNDMELYNKIIKFKG